MTDTPTPATVEDLKITHTFHVADQPMFTHRGPGEWLEDVLLFDHAGDYTIVDQGPWQVTVTATETVLRLVCVLLNQHAEQSPADGTPADEANRLEATLAAAHNGVPVCPRCGRRDWKIDVDVTNRAAILIGADPKVWVDRCGPEGTTTNGIGVANCMGCAHEVLLDGETAQDDANPGLAARLITAAKSQIGRHDGDWAILTDYRQF